MKDKITTLLTFIFVLFTLSSWTVSYGNYAKNTDNSPVQVLKDRNQAVEAILKNAGNDVSPETKEQLKQVINEIIDFNALAQLSLGKYWDEISEKQRQEFVNVFSQLIKNSSVKKLEIYKADRLVYEPAQVDHGKATVTTIAYKDRKQVEIVYKMHLVNGEWKVYDMVIDGLSTARNYRDSFYKEIAKTSYQEMYDKLVKKLES